MLRPSTVFIFISEACDGGQFLRQPIRILCRAAFVRFALALLKVQTRKLLVQI